MLVHFPIFHYVFKNSSARKNTDGIYGIIYMFVGGHKGCWMILC